MVKKLIYPIKRNGIKALRADDIAKYMDVSKATLYKYFSSKDEIIEGLVQYYIAQYIEPTVEQVSDAAFYIKQWQRSFREELLIMNFISEAFKSDLRESYPELMEKVKKAMDCRNLKLKAFYEKGIEFGVFNPLNPTIVILQDEAFFRDILDPLYLMDKNLTINTVIRDYYECKRVQVLTNKYQEFGYDDEWNETIDQLIQKITCSIM